jgi:hypothetical protein
MGDIMTRIPQNTPVSGIPFQFTRGLFTPLDVQGCYDDILVVEKTAIALIATGMRRYTPETKWLVRWIRLQCRITLNMLEQYDKCFTFNVKASHSTSDCTQ